MDENTKRSLLKDEYSMLQQFYEDFDKRILGIKGWSATIAIAAIGGGFAQNRYLWLFAAAASLLFWLLESVWRGFQYMYAPRIAQLEGVFRQTISGILHLCKFILHGLRPFKSGAFKSKPCLEWELSPFLMLLR